MRRILRFLLLVLVLAAAAGAVAVMFIDIPAPVAPVEKPASLPAEEGAQ